MCIPEIDLKSNTEKLLLNEAEGRLCKKKGHPLQSCEKVYPCSAFDLLEAGGEETNGFKTNKLTE